MSRPNSLKLAALIAVVWCVGAASVPLREALLITQYDGDALHLLDITMRMASGEAIHADFMTPIGALAFWPMVIFLSYGWPAGVAFGLGQALFAAFFALLLWRAAGSRLPPATGYVFAALCMGLVLSLTHGPDGGLAVSMHYNRWGWALAFVAILLVLLPDRGEPRVAIDGLCVAVCVTGLVLLKATYAVAVAPALIAAALLCGRGALLGAGMLAGVVLAAVLSLVLGPAHWLDYAANLVEVSGSALRPSPGVSLADLLVSPTYLPGAIVAIAAVIAVRRAGYVGEGLSILLLFGAFVYITWQNFGNDPVWLILLASILMAFRSSGENSGLRQVLGGLGLAAAMLVAPLALNHLVSPLRHLFEPPTRFVEIVPGSHVMLPKRPAELIRGRVKLNTPGEIFDVVPDPDADERPLAVASVPLPSCQVTTGIPSAISAIVQDIRGRPSVFVADILGSHWLYGLEPLNGGAPWNYGDLSGIESAEFIVVPLCPVSENVRRALVDRLNDTHPGLRLIERTPRVLVFGKD